MRIIVVGGAGTIGLAAVKALSDRHEVVVVGRRSGTVHVDICSPGAVRTMYHQVGSFDALVCAAGDAYLGPFDSMSEAEFVFGIDSKLLGQIRLVLLGRSLISDGGSLTLVSGYLLDDPIPAGAGFSVANGGVEGFVSAAALGLDRGVRINAASPSPCPPSAPPSPAAWRGGAPEKSTPGIGVPAERDTHDAIHGWASSRRVTRMISAAECLKPSPGCPSSAITVIASLPLPRR